MTEFQGDNQDREGPESVEDFGQIRLKFLEIMRRAVSPEIKKLPLKERRVLWSDLHAQCTVLLEKMKKAAESNPRVYKSKADTSERQLQVLSAMIIGLNE